jgi:hypothetical protein
MINLRLRLRLLDRPSVPFQSLQDKHVNIIRLAAV